MCVSIYVCVGGVECVVCVYEYMCVCVRGGVCCVCVCVCEGWSVLCVRPREDSILISTGKC